MKGFFARFMGLGTTGSDLAYSTGCKIDQVARRIQVFKPYLNTPPKELARSICILALITIVLTWAIFLSYPHGQVGWIYIYTYMEMLL